MQDKKRAIVCVDLINEIVDAKGRLAGKGYSAFVERNGTLDRVEELLKIARSQELMIIHVGLGFSNDYREHPQESPLLGGARKVGALLLGSWATEFHPKAAPGNADVVVRKHRVSAFHGTPLDVILRTNVIQEVVVCGVATDLAVQTTVRDGHDRDYAMTVAADCCIAASEQDHAETLRVLGKVAAIKKGTEI